LDVPQTESNVLCYLLFTQTLCDVSPSNGPPKSLWTTAGRPGCEHGDVAATDGALITAAEIVLALMADIQSLLLIFHSSLFTKTAKTLPWSSPR
jgi:hypothetical protein